MTSAICHEFVPRLLLGQGNGVMAGFHETAALHNTLPLIYSEIKAASPDALWSIGQLMTPDRIIESEIGARINHDLIPLAPLSQRS